MLVLLLDMAGTDGRAPWDDYRNLLTELKLYDPLAGLLARAVVIIDEKGKTAYTQLVQEIAQEPDYSAALQAL